MPTIYDNIEKHFLEGLEKVMEGAVSVSFCVGYLHLWGWRLLAEGIERLPNQPGKPPCRILVGMHRPPETIMREVQGLKNSSNGGEETIGGSLRTQRKRKIVEDFKRQLEFGIPTKDAETTLQRLAAQLRAKKVQIKSFLRYPLHAKLYLVERRDPMASLVGFVGSSNFTHPGLTGQGELNVDVLDQDAAQKLADWFERLWQDNLAVDISAELAELIESSWACQQNIRPYLVYLKIAYHLSEEARQAPGEFKMPDIFAQEETPLLDFQEKAVFQAAKYLLTRGGALLGDVVGLGKTLMAIAIARILQEDDDLHSTLIICPPKLKPMWEQYCERYKLIGKVCSLGHVQSELPSLSRHRLVIIDESHNLRNREGKRYQAILDYIERNESRVLLLTATPFNKHYEDLGNQLRLFVDEDQDLGVRPERFFQQWAKEGKTDADFRAQYQISPTTLRAFEKSEYPEDWQDLLRMFMVRRTRSYIQRNYAMYDPKKGRYYVLLGGQPFYLPTREVKTVGFSVQDDSPSDPYAQLLSQQVVSLLERLYLPRYGLIHYLRPGAAETASAEEKKIIANLNRAGRRLIGVCRTNFFKRLESSGYSFLLSIRRHILRNLVTLYALQNGLPIPIGVQDVAAMDPTQEDRDVDALLETVDPEQEPEEAPESVDSSVDSTVCLDRLKDQAKEIYHSFQQNARRFQWIDGRFFTQELSSDLEADVTALKTILDLVPVWRSEDDQKLCELLQLLTGRDREEKVLIFTQFADTAHYLGRQLKQRGVTQLEVVTGQSPDPLALACRFSPRSNKVDLRGQNELRVLVATDVLAEGQNLQDCYIVVNYDLPWAIIRLSQRVGRVDRIGQTHDTIFVYSFLPADGVERIIGLRRRLCDRLQMNQEVIGTDESFFGEAAEKALRDLYAENPSVLNGDETDEDIDLASMALQVWNSASEADRRAAEALPSLVSTTAPLRDNPPAGMITYLRFPNGLDSLIRVDSQGRVVSQSLSAIFRAVACQPETPPLPQAPNHYELINCSVQAACAERDQQKNQPGGQLGTYRSTARKVYERLKAFREKLLTGAASASVPLEDLDKVLSQMHRYPLKEGARDSFRRQLRLNITDQELAEMALHLLQQEKLCQITESSADSQEPQILCALGLRHPHEVSYSGGNE